MTVVWLVLLVGLLAVGVGPVPNAFSGFWKPVPNARLSCPALIQGQELSPTPTYYDMLCWHLWKACYFLNRGEKGVDSGGGREEVGGMRGGEGKRLL